LKSKADKINYKDTSGIEGLIQLTDKLSSEVSILTEKQKEAKKLSGKANLKNELIQLTSELESRISAAEEINGIKIIAEKLEINDINVFKEVGETVNKLMKNGVALFASETGGKINLVCVVSPNLISEKNLNAGKLISEVAKELGGGGGGKANIATAGGKEVSEVEKALKNFKINLKLKL
jgi:alanyl-tRNA synthetase